MLSLVPTYCHVISTAFNSVFVNLDIVNTSTLLFISSEQKIIKINKKLSRGI